LTEELTRNQKIIIDAFLALAALYIIGLHLMIYGLNYADFEKRDMAVQDFYTYTQAELKQDHPYYILQVTENPFKNQVSIYGYCRFCPTNKTVIVRYTFHDGGAFTKEII